jgi:hypothetical protein
VVPPTDAMLMAEFHNVIILEVTVIFVNIH